MLGWLGSFPQFLENAFERLNDLYAVNPRLVEVQLKVEMLRRGTVCEYIVLWPPGLCLYVGLPELLPRGTPLICYFLHECRHFLCGLLPNYLQK